jgi:hypothetical protein
MLSTLVENLGKNLQMTDSISSKSPHSYTLAFDEANVITISEIEEGGYLVYSLLAPCPKQNPEALYTLLLDSNLFGQATHGAVIGLSEEGNNLTLSQELDYNTNDREFKEKLEDFLNIADFWRQKIAEL